MLGLVGMGGTSDSLPGQRGLDSKDMLSIGLWSIPLKVGLRLTTILVDDDCSFFWLLCFL